MTETTKGMTVRQVLATIRADLAGENYLSGTRYYECSKGTLIVRNKPCVGGSLLGVFEAELVGSNGDKVRTYEV